MSKYKFIQDCFVCGYPINRDVTDVCPNCQHDHKAERCGDGTREFYIRTATDLCNKPYPQYDRAGRMVAA